MTDGLAIVLGTRPEIIKLAPLIQRCEAADIPFVVIHTGQHYSDSLDAVFFDQLDLPEPDYHLGVGSGPHGAQTGKMLTEIERILTDRSPHGVVVQGDTNSVLAGALASSKLDVQLGHVEAGLRSFDREMPEEINRVVTDHVADRLYAPTNQSKQYLLAEGIPDRRILVTGNTIVDSLRRNRELAREKSNVLEELAVDPGEFFLLTAHRPKNVDDETRFSSLLGAVAEAARDHDVDVIYPIHPRGRERLRAFDIEVPKRIRVIEPLEYLDFIRLEATARLILTDSGGVQEEACVLGVPCVTLRDSTERPETIEVGANTLAHPDESTVRRNVDGMLSLDADWRNPFGDGRASQRILEDLRSDVETVHA